MKPLLITSILLTLLALSCRYQLPKDCILTKEQAISKYEERLIKTESNDSIQEFRDVGIDTIIGSYYTFKKGVLRSYYFFIHQDSNYSKEENDQILESDSSNSSLTDYCSYAEMYDRKGQFSKSVGIPLVYNRVRRVQPDSIRVDSYFFSLNKTYDSIYARTNTGFNGQLTLTMDTLFSNTEVGSFLFNFHGTTDIQIYINGHFTDNCAASAKNFSDSIILRYENGKIKNGG
jgi:hypothetical protein